MTDWRQTMEQLVRTRERALLGYAYLVCSDPIQAQDLVQDALVRTFSRPRPGLTPEKAEGYVRRAITSVYIDQYRRGQRWQKVRHLFTPQEVGDDEFAPVDASAEVSQALMTLPPRVRACVVLRYFDDLTVADVASELGIAEGTVKRYLSDGVHHLEHVLGDLEDAETGAETAVLVGRREGRN